MKEIRLVYAHSAPHYQVYPLINAIDIPEMHGAYYSRRQALDRITKLEEEGYVVRDASKKLREAWEAGKNF